MNSGDICHGVLEPQTFSWLNGSSYGDGRLSRRFGQQFATAPICSGTRLGQGWEIGPRCRRPEIARKCGAAVGQERPSGKPGGLFLLSSLRANGSRECAPDDRLRCNPKQHGKNGFLRRFAPGQGIVGAFRSPSVIVREGGRSSTPRALNSIAGPYDYWMPAFAGTTSVVILSAFITAWSEATPAARRRERLLHGGAVGRARFSRS